MVIDLLSACGTCVTIHGTLDTCNWVCGIPQEIASRWRAEPCLHLVYGNDWAVIIGEVGVLSEGAGGEMAVPNRDGKVMHVRNVDARRFYTESELPNSQRVVVPHEMCYAPTTGV